MKRAGLLVALVGGLASVAGIDDARAEDTTADTFDLLAQGAARSHAGDHLGAIELYERAYRQDDSMELLVMIGSEYRKAGKPDEAIQNFCAYLAVEPTGDSAAFAASEVFSIEAALGRRVGGNVCASAEPMLPPIVIPIDRQITQPGSQVSQREIAGITLGAAGIVGITTGVIFGLQAKNISDELDGHNPGMPWPSNIKSLEDRGQRAERLELMFAIGGVLATATGAYLYVSGHTHRIANERIVVSPALLQQGGGLAISGGF